MQTNPAVEQNKIARWSESPCPVESVSVESVRKEKKKVHGGN